ncbi:MAG: hypothetical protein ACSHXI_16465 [Hoeflea sp.]|uniref:hypothetical protein n=1 Tax=Hoeflea sp. TaxID=1940281 RepID=UPI003EF60677
MILGSFHIEHDSVHTHRDSYRKKDISVVSVRRPFLILTVMNSLGIASFCVAFADLLYPSELLALIGVSIATFISGLMIGQLKLLSRDLRGSELSDAIWGDYHHLNRVRRELVRAMRDANDEA